MNTKKYDVFISYRRRETTIDKADILYKTFCEKYPKTISVSLDRKNLSDGEWLKELIRRIDTSEIFYLIIGSDTFVDNNAIYNDQKYEIFRKCDNRNELYNYIDNHSEIYNEYDILKIEIVRGLKRFYENKLRFILFRPEQEIKISAEFSSINAIIYNAINTNFRNKLDNTIFSRDEWAYDKIKEIDERNFLFKYTKLGEEIIPEEIYFDTNRAKKQYGFNEEIYVPRTSVDNRVVQALNDEIPIVLLQGRSGSGKTRALYQLCKSGDLKDSKVVIINKRNVENIVENLVASNHLTNVPIYFLCDQIVDVLADLSPELVESLLSVIKKSKGLYQLIGSNTEIRMKDWKSNFEDWNLEARVDFQIITIPLLSDDPDFAKFVETFGIKNDKNITVVADLIPGLKKKYIQDIVNKVNKDLKKNSTAIQLLPVFLKSLQLVYIFRKEHRLFIAINLLVNENPNISVNDFRLLLNVLVNNNVLTIYRNGIGMAIAGLSNVDFDLSAPFNECSFDNEMFKAVAPIELTFTINEFLLTYYAEVSECRQWLYDWHEPTELKLAINSWYNAFKNIGSISRIITRVPDYKLQNIVNGWAGSKLEDYETPREQLQYAYSVLIGRSESEEKVSKIILDKTVLLKEGDQYCSILIGELYRFAQCVLKPKCDGRYEIFLSKIREYRSFYHATIETKVVSTPTEHDMYAIWRELDALFELKEDLQIDDLLGFIKTYLDKTNSCDASTRALLLRNTYKYFSVILSRYGNSEQCFEKIMAVLNTYNIPITNKLLTCFVKHCPEKNYRTMVEVLFGVNLKSGTFDDEQKSLLEFCLYAMMRNSRHFAYAKELYELSKKYFEKKDTKLLSLLINTCEKSEFQQMINFVEAETNGNLNEIILNKIINKAPGYVDALYYLYKSSETESYALTHILDKLAKKDDENAFIFAYEVVNCKKLRAYAKEKYTLSKLYNIATDIGQEHYVDRLSGLNENQILTNVIFSNAKLKKSYRSLNEAFGYYEKIKNLWENYDRLYTDNFNMMVMKVDIDNDTNEEEKNTIRQQLIQDNANYKDKWILDGDWVIAVVKLGALQICSKNDSQELVINPEFETHLHLLDNVRYWNSLLKLVSKSNDSNKRDVVKLLCERYLNHRKDCGYPHNLDPDRIMKDILSRRGLIQREVIDRQIKPKFVPYEIPENQSIVDFLTAHMTNRGIILPSIFSMVTHKAYIRKKSGKKVDQLKDILDFITQSTCWHYLDHSALVNLYMFALQWGSKGVLDIENNPDFIKRWEDVESNDDIIKSTIALGKLSNEKLLINIYPLRSRYYFYSWLKVYLDIYQTLDNIFKFLSEDTLKTIKIHIQRHYEFDYFLRNYINKIPNANSLLASLFADENETVDRPNLKSMFNYYKQYTISNIRSTFAIVEGYDLIELSDSPKLVALVECL